MFSVNSNNLRVIGLQQVLPNPRRGEHIAKNPSELKVQILNKRLATDDMPGTLVKEPSGPPSPFLTHMREIAKQEAEREPSEITLRNKLLYAESRIPMLPQYDFARLIEDMGIRLELLIFYEGEVVGINWDMFEEIEMDEANRQSSQDEISWENIMNTFIENFNAQEKIDKLIENEGLDIRV